MANNVEPVTAPPSKDELDLRMNKVRSLMAREGLDVYVAAHTDNVYYLTNFAYIPFERPFFLIIPTERKPGPPGKDLCRHIESGDWRQPQSRHRIVAGFSLEGSDAWQDHYR
jgi:Xaa-Pro aminopeptidase